MHTTFWSENLKVKDNLEDQGIDERLLKLISKEIGCEGLEKIYLAQNRVCWCALINTAMDHLVSYNAGIFCLSEVLLAS
jgi:hypothetical protein